MPDEYKTIEWLDAVEQFHLEQGHEVDQVLAFSNPIYDDPYNLMHRKQVDAEWGVEVIWR